MSVPRRTALIEPRRGGCSSSRVAALRLTAALLFALLVGGVVAGAFPAGVAAQDRIPSGATRAKVVAVLDGDTIVVEVAGRRVRVRYIGIDTPETKRPDTPVQCFGKAATRANERLVAGERVGTLISTPKRDG